MSIEAFFDHKCDIYHLIKEQKSPGFNLPSAPSTSTYPKIADESGVECHFTIRVGNNTSLVQNEPQNAKPIFILFPRLQIIRQARLR